MVKSARQNFGRQTKSNTVVLYCTEMTRSPQTEGTQTLDGRNISDSVLSFDSSHVCRLYSQILPWSSPHARIPIPYHLLISITGMYSNYIPKLSNYDITTYNLFVSITAIYPNYKPKLPNCVCKFVCLPVLLKTA